MECNVHARNVSWILKDCCRCYLECLSSSLVANRMNIPIRFQFLHNCSGLERIVVKQFFKILEHWTPSKLQQVTELKVKEH